jgi:hypothetical protein
MAEEPQPLGLPEEDRAGRRRQYVLVAALLAIAALATGLWLTMTAPETPPPPVPKELPPMGAEEQAYRDQVEISNLELSRWANFLGQEVTYLDGVVTNHGQHNLVALELTVEFTDPYGQVVLRETIRPIGDRLSPLGAPQGALPPRQSRTFRAGFEHMPADWNQGTPRIRISGLLLHPLPARRATEPD